jgi:Flp pilus assembly protein TadB
MTVKVEDVNDNDIDDSEEDDNMMTTVTRRRTCKRRRAGPQKRRTTIEDVGKENGVDEGEGNDSLIAEIVVVVVVVLLTILLIAVISKITIKLLVVIIIVVLVFIVVADHIVRILTNRTSSRKINRFHCTGKRVNIQALLHTGIPPPSDRYWKMMCWCCC